MSREVDPDEHDSADFELTDELLRSARWPEPRPLQLARLETRWRRQLPLATGGRLRIWMAAAAALILITSGTLLWRQLRDAGAVQHAENGHSSDRAEAIAPRVAQTPSDTGTSEDAVEPSFVREESLDAKPNRFVSREPTPLELLAFVRAGGTLPRASRRAQRVPIAGASDAPAKVLEPTWRDRLDSALEVLRSDPDASVSEWASRFGSDRIRIEEELQRRVQSSEEPLPLAEIALLSEIATVRSLPFMRSLFARPEARDLVLPALLRLETTRHLTQHIARSDDTAARRYFLAALLGRDNPQAIASFLGFVNNKEFSVAALESLALARHLPVDGLFEFVHGPRQQLRLAAARVLGRFDDPAVLQQLMTMVWQNDQTHEAFIGLLSSDSDAARKFLLQAEQELSLVATLRSAEHHLEEIAYTSGREEL